MTSMTAPSHSEGASMTDDTIHTCSYSCERPGCIRAQRDELVSRLEALTAAQQQAVATPLPGDKGSVQALFNPTLQPMQQGGGEDAPPSAPVGVELFALRVQEWLHREHDILCP